MLEVSGPMFDRMGFGVPDDIKFISTIFGFILLL